MYQSYHEIFGQGGALSETYRYIGVQEETIRRFFAPDDYEEIVFVACGSSYWGALSVSMTMQSRTGRRCFAVKSGEILLNPPLFQHAYRRPLVIAPSRSGATEETLRAIRFLKQTYGCRVLAIAEYPQSPLQGLADLTLLLPWANEDSVCQTRSFSCLYLAQILISALLGGSPLAGAVEDYLQRFPQLSAHTDAGVKALVDANPGCRRLTVLGSGVQYGVAIEGAYIGVEMAQFPASYYSLLEYRHGPVVTAGSDCLLAVFSRAAGRDYEIQMAAEAAAQGCQILAVVDQGPFGGADYTFSLGCRAPDEIIALYGVFVLQAFAYYKAVALGLNPDQPGNLVPFITLGGDSGEAV